MIVDLIEILNDISLYMIGMIKKGSGVILEAASSPLVDQVHTQLFLDYKPAV